MEDLGYITLKQASEISGINYESLKRRCQTGAFPGAIKKGNTWFVPRSEIIKDETEEQDLLLKVISILAENSVSFKITLFINGNVIAGELISKKYYFALVEERLRESCPEDDAIGLRDSIIPTIFKNLREQADNQQEEPEHYLHLRDVMLLGEDGKREFGKGFLRIKMNEIDGFIWGAPDA